MTDFRFHLSLAARARRRLAAVLAGLSLVIAAGTVPAVAEIRVAASVKPVQSLVAFVMQGAGTPDLIVRGGGSPHTYALKPSDAARLSAANLVFWIGPGFEAFLEKPLATLAGDATVVELADVPGLTLYPLRESGTFEPHEDEAAAADHATAAGDAHGHAHGDGLDMHFWLDPANAAVLGKAIAESLAAADPAQATLYRSNAETLAARLDALSTALDAKLAPVRDRPFVVFHDAYQSFEKRFNLTVAGSITVSPEVQPGASRIAAIHDKLASLKAACVFAEPQFEPALVDTVIEGSAARSGILDPEGADLEPGPDLYFQLVSRIADNLVTCLGAP